MAKKRKSQGQGGKSTKEAKKRSRAKSKKHALRSATYAVKKLIDSALAEGQPHVDPGLDPARRGAARLRRGLGPHRADVLLPARHGAPGTDYCIFPFKAYFS